MYLCLFCMFGFRVTATTEIYMVGHTLALHVALPFFVKGAALDRRVRLAQEQGARGVEPVAPRDRLRRVEMLARRKAPAADAIDDDLDPRRVVPVAQPHMVRRPLVAAGRGNGTVHRKGGLGQGEPELPHPTRSTSCREQVCQYV